MSREKNFTKNLKNISNEKRSNIWELCSSVWFYLIKEPEAKQETIFTSFLKNFDYYDIQLEDYDYDLNQIYGEYNVVNDIKNRIISNLIEKNPEEDSFYHCIWEKIKDPFLFSNDNSAALFLCSLWSDTRIPYYKLDTGPLMDDDEYKHILSELDSLFKKVNFILSVPLQQRTQCSSLLLKLAREINDENKQAVFWSYVLHTSNKMTEFSLLEEFEKKIKTTNYEPLKLPEGR